MLKLLRKKKITKRIYYGLAIIIIPAFVIWGSASAIRGREDKESLAGVIFGEKITREEFYEANRAWMVQLKLEYGEKANEIAAALFDPIDAAWERIILLREAKKRKIRVPDQYIVSAITSQGAFARDGRFDPRSYKIFLQYSIMEPPRVFEEQLRDNIAINILFNQVTGNVSLTEPELAEKYAQQNDQTRVKYVAFLNSQYNSEVTATDEEVESAYARDKEKFRIPEQRNASYLTIEVKEDASDEDKKKIAEKIKGVLEAAARDGLEKAAADAELELQKTGLISLEDPIPSLGWMPQLSNLLFNLPVNEVSRIVEIKNGLYIFEVKERQESVIPELKDIKDKVRVSVLEEKGREIAQKAAEGFLEKVKDKPEEFEKATAEAGLDVKESPLFSRESYIPELGMAQPLKEAAFDLAKDAVAQQPVALKQGFFVIKSMERAPFDEEKFKKEKDGFAQALLDEKRTAAFQAFAENLKKEAGLVSYIEKPKASTS